MRTVKNEGIPKNTFKKATDLPIAILGDARRMTSVLHHDEHAGSTIILIEFATPPDGNPDGETHTLKHVYKLAPTGIELLVTSTPSRGAHGRHDTRDLLAPHLASLHGRIADELHLNEALLHPSNVYAPLGPWVPLPFDYPTDSHIRALWHIPAHLSQDRLIKLALHGVRAMGDANILITTGADRTMHAAAGRESLGDGYYRFNLPSSADPGVVEKTVREGLATYNALARDAAHDDY
jgi:hypothetical protein